MFSIYLQLPVADPFLEKVNLSDLGKLMFPKIQESAHNVKN